MNPVAKGGEVVFTGEAEDTESLASAKSKAKVLQQRKKIQTDSDLSESRCVSRTPPFTPTYTPTSTPFRGSSILRAGDDSRGSSRSEVKDKSPLSDRKSSILESKDPSPPPFFCDPPGGKKLSLLQRRRQQMAALKLSASACPTGDKEFMGGGGGGGAATPKETVRTGLQVESGYDSDDVEFKEDGKGLLTLGEDALYGAIESAMLGVVDTGSMRPLTKEQEAFFYKTGHIEMDLSEKRYGDEEPGLAKAAHDGIVFSEQPGNEEFRPKPIQAGKSGSYFIYSPDGVVIGVFKPEDEEMGAKNAPDVELGNAKAKHMVAAAEGVAVGDGAIFEVVAFNMAKYFQKGLVPETSRITMASNSFSTKGCKDPTEEDLTKTGSLQRFAPGKSGPELYPVLLEEIKMQKEAEEAAEKAGVDKETVFKASVLTVGGEYASQLIPKIIEAKAKPEQFQMMMAFDLALYGTDRNAGNVLVDDDGDIHLIDHSILLAKGYRARMNCVWMQSETADKRFTDVAAAKIRALDPTLMVEELRAEFDRSGKPFDEGHEKTLYHSVSLLKAGVNLGLTPNQIANMYDCDPETCLFYPSQVSELAFKYDGSVDINKYYESAIREKMDKK
ncbi:MAG: hypothetical protein P0S95_07580 [Rhabdochlamydiaceae bacterium]|nr:hypothetical protein [Candidatus Amphrikana amoebophyrae]